MDIRPRTLGEICDDAWRLALADAPVLLLFNALFMVPAFLVLLLLLALPAPEGMGQYVLPALAALLLPLMGLASGACQGLLQRRLAGPQPIGARSVSEGIHLAYATGSAGLKHAAARALLLCFTLPGPLLLLVSFLPDTAPILRFLGFLLGSLLTFLLTLPLWIASTSLHVLLSAGANRSGTLLQELRRDVAAARGKAAVLVFSRLPLVLLLALQLHLFAKVILWTADNLAGFDTALLDVQLAFFDNPVYTLALFLLSWLLLAPVFEAANFLLHTDIRTRQEGLDLQYRVQRAFGGVDSSFRETRNLLRSLTVAALIFLLPGMATAKESPQATVHAVRQEIETIRGEIDKAEPYPGGRAWMGRLRGLQAKLARMEGGDPRRFRWFEQALDDFADRKKEDALRTLDNLRQRLSLLEDSLAPNRQPAAQTGDKRSPQDVKSLLRGGEGSRQRTQPGNRRQSVEEDRAEARREEARRKAQQGEAPRAGGGRATPISLPASSGGGFSLLGWLLLGGLALAVVVVSLIPYLRSPKRKTGGDRKGAAAGTAGSAEDDVRQVLEQSPAALWRQADALAENGRFREAVRLVYLAVLALLNRQGLIRFEPTRTNGEYVRQVRLSEQAPPELHASFEQLTHQFETAWYGERACEENDYRACRALADEMQQVVVGV